MTLNDIEQPILVLASRLLVRVFYEDKEEQERRTKKEKYARRIHVNLTTRNLCFLYKIFINKLKYIGKVHFFPQKRHLGWL